MRHFLGVVVFLSLVILLSLSIPLGIRMWDHNNQVTVCRRFQEETGYQTKFVDYNFFYYECLLKGSDGKWIPADKLREVGQ